MLGLYRKESFKIGTFVAFPNNVTKLLLLRKDGYYEDVEKNVLIGNGDVFKCTLKNLVDLIDINPKYITKNTAIKYYISALRQQKNEQINSL